VSAAITWQRSARGDVAEIFRQRARGEGVAAARRFLAAVEETATRLARHPGIGTQYDFEMLGHVELRYFPVSRYRSYIMFYRQIPDGVDVVRVLHGARDLASLLIDEP